MMNSMSGQASRIRPAEERAHPPNRKCSKCDTKELVAEYMHSAPTTWTTKCLEFPQSVVLQGCTFVQALIATTCVIAH